MTVEEFIDQWRDPTPFVTVSTSGSTGTPKVIRLEKEMMRASARRTNRFFGINPRSRLHLPLAVDYIAGKMMVVRALEANATLTCEPPSNTPDLAPLGDIDLLAVVPSQMEYLLRRKKSHPHSLSGRIRNYLIGGSAIPATMRTRIASAGMTAWESYGMTETASHIALRPVTARQLPFTTLPGIRCSLGENHNLIIRIPVATNSVTTMTIVTRDVANLLDPEHFLILGRLDNAIITGGVKVHPEQVEATLSTLRWPFRFYVGSIPDSKWTNKVTLFIDASTITSPDTYTDHMLLEEMRTVLGGAELPRAIIRMKQFSYTPNGKIIRK